MRNKAADIAWKFANKLRDKYAAQRVVTAMISYVYISWEAKWKKDLIDDPTSLINRALDEFGKNFDDKQLQVFRESIDLLKNEVDDLFQDDFINYLESTDANALRELLAFLIKRTDKIDEELDDFSNNRIASVFAKAIEEESHQKLLDPCIGSGQLLVELADKGIIDKKKVEIRGVEENPRTSLIAYINLKINGFKNFSIDTGNALKADLGDEQYDLIISDLPLGIRLRDRSFGGENVPAHWRFYHLLFKTTLQRLNKTGSAYFTSSAHVIRDLNKYSKNEQAELPIYDSVKNYSQRLAKIIDASDFADWSFTSLPLFLLGFQGSMVQDLEINKLTESGEVGSSNSISKTDWYFYDYINDPSFFLSETFSKIETEGREKLLSLGWFFARSTVSNKAKKNVGEDSPAVFSLRNVQNISDWKEIRTEHLKISDDSEKVQNRYKFVESGSWILIPVKKQVAIGHLNVDSNVFISRHLAAIKPKGSLSKLDKEWLKGTLLSTFVQDQINAISGARVVRVLHASKLLEHILIPNQNEKEKEEFVNNWKEKRIEELEEKQEKVSEGYKDVVKKEKNDKLSEEFDLIHDLQHTLRNDISSIKGAVTSIEKYLINKEETGKRVNMNEPVSKLRPGADPKLIDSVRERFDMLKNTTESMSNFLKKYKELLKFDPKRHNPKWIKLKDFFEKHGKGYGEFNFEVREIFDEKRQNNPYELKADPDVLRLVFKNIISNAIDHAFTEKRAQYSLVVEIKQSTEEVQLSEEKSYPEFSLNIIIKNDGEPILDEISESEFFSRGIGNSRTGSGLGGFHIKRGVESMGGEVKLLEPEEDDPYQTQLLIQFFDDDVRFKSPNVGFETKVSGSEALGKS